MCGEGCGLLQFYGGKGVLQQNTCLQLGIILCDLALI